MHKERNIKVQFKAARRVNQLRNSLPQEILLVHQHQPNQGKDYPQFNHPLENN